MALVPDAETTLGVTAESRYVPGMAESSELPPKKDIMTALLEGSSVYLHVDPRRAGVVVPKWLTNQPQLVLQVGLSMAVRIPDLEVGDDGVSCTLSFNRSPFWCFMPWTAIYGLVGDDGRGMIWPEDVPIELSQPQPARMRPRLAAVPDVEREPTADGALESAQATVPSVPTKPATKKPRARAPAKPKAAKPARTLVDADGVTTTPTRKAAAPKAPVRAPAVAKAEVTRNDDSEIHEDPVPPTQATKGGKRPLPPYLRVVK